MAEGGLRARRVAEGVRAHLTTVLQREVADKRLAGLVITSVTLPDDLSVARVQVRLLGEADARLRRDVVRALEGASGRLKRGLGRALGLKRTPALRFDYDSGPDATRRVEELLEEIASERKGEG